MNGLAPTRHLARWHDLRRSKRAIPVNERASNSSQRSIKGQIILGLLLAPIFIADTLSTTERAEIAAKMANIKVGGKAAEFCKIPIAPPSQ